MVPYPLLFFIWLANLFLFPCKVYVYILDFVEMASGNGIVSKIQLLSGEYIKTDELYCIDISRMDFSEVK